MGPAARLTGSRRANCLVEQLLARYGCLVFTADVDRVERVVAATIAALPGSLAAPSQRIAHAGGKRSRPMLVLAAARCGGGPLPARAIDAAAAIELLHVAALVHDDLMERATARRGVPTVNAAEGPATALLAGDALLGAAGRLAATVDTDTAEIVQSALIDLCAGQVLEEEHRYRPDTDSATVLEVARGKSGTLTGVACRLAGTLAGCLHPDLAAALTDFGYAFGTCLQLLDDTLDVISTEQRLGKAVEVDFPAGVVTLPALRPLHHDHQLRDLFRPDLTAVERARAFAILRRGGGIHDTVATAHGTARAARRELTAVRDLGDAATIDWLAALPERYVLDQLRLVAPEHRHLLRMPDAPAYDEESPQLAQAVAGDGGPWR